MYRQLIKYAGVIPSVNDMYKVGRRGTKSWIYLNPVIDNYKKFIREELIKNGAIEHFSGLKNVVLDVAIIMVFKQNFWTRDISNTTKATEDAVVSAIAIDDRFNLRVSSSKMMNDKDDFEYIAIVIDYKSIDDAEYKWSHLDG